MLFLLTVACSRSEVASTVSPDAASSSNIGLDGAAREEPATWIPTNVQLIDPILRVAVTPDGTVWAATASYGLLRIRQDGVGWERLDLPSYEFIRAQALEVFGDETGPLPTRILFAVDGLGMYSVDPATEMLELLYESDPEDERTWIVDISHDTVTGEIIAVGSGITVTIDTRSGDVTADNAGYTDVLHLAGSDRVLAVVRGKSPPAETLENIVRLVPGKDREPSHDGFPATANELAQDPFEHSTVYVTSNDGLWISQDEGRTWERSGLEGEHTWAIAVSSSIPGLLAVSTRGPGVFVSEDSGESWRSLGLNPARTYGFALAVEFGANYEQYVFVGTREGSVFKQNLSGDAFALVSGSFPVDSPRPIRPDELAYPIDRVSFPVFFVFGEDGRIYFTNHQERIVSYLDSGVVETLLELDETEFPINTRGEDGVLGIEIVETESGEYAYVYYGHADIDRPEVRYRHRLIRFPSNDPTNDDVEIVLEDLPAGPIEESLHVAGAVKQGPDGALYISIGDTRVPEDAQDISNLRGTILRIWPDGTAPEDNPFPEQPMLWAYGFRNPFDFSFDGAGRMFAVDLGGAIDEINIIEPGANYGWPLVGGGPDYQERFTDPIWSFPSIGTPSGIVVYSHVAHPEYAGDIFVCEFNFRKVRWLREEEHLGGLLTDMGWIADQCITTLVQGADGDIYYTSLDGIRKFSLGE